MSRRLAEFLFEPLSRSLSPENLLLHERAHSIQLYGETVIIVCSMRKTYCSIFFFFFEICDVFVYEMSFADSEQLRLERSGFGVTVAEVSGAGVSITTAR